MLNNAVLSLALGVLRTRNKDPGHIPKPLNAFICFRKAFFKAEKQERTRRLRNGHMSGEVDGTQQKHVSIRAGGAWRALSVEERTPYILEAAELKRLHELKYPWLKEKGSFAVNKTEKTSNLAAQKRRGGQGRKSRVLNLGSPSGSSSLRTGYGVPAGLPYATSSSQALLSVPVSIYSSGHEADWSLSSPYNDVLRLPTPALTPSHGLSPSPAPSDLYSIPPSENVSRVASPAVLDLASDDAFYSDLPQALADPFTAYGEDSPPHQYQIYGYQPSFNGCVPLASHDPGHIAYPYAPPLAVSNGAFPDPFVMEAIPISHSMSLDAEFEVAQAGYFWQEEPVQQAPLIPAVDATRIDQAIAYLFSLPPCNDPFAGSSDL